MTPELRPTLRALFLKNRTANAICVLTLALGIGANTAMFSALEAVLIRSLPYPKADSLVIARTTFEDHVNWTSSAPDYFDYRDENEAFSELSAITGFTRDHTVTGGGRPEQVTGLYVSTNFFTTLGIEPSLGRAFSTEDGFNTSPNVALVSRSYWERRFGAAAEALGSTLVLDGNPTTIVGVMPAGFHFVYEVDVWRPMRPNGPWVSARRFHNWLILGRLRPGVTLEGAQGQMDVIADRLASQYPDSNKNKGIRLTPLHDVLVQRFESGLLLLSVTLGLVLLIACANVAGLLLARGASRRTEIAVRAALGASRLRLTWQLLLESLILASLAGLAGLVFATVFQGLFLDFFPLEQSGLQELNVSIPVLVFSLFLSLSTGLIFGTVPAFRGARRDVNEDLKQSARGGDLRSGSRLRSGLVAAQVAVSVVLLVGAGLLTRSFTLLTAVDPGFKPANLLTAEIRLPLSRYDTPMSRIEFYRRLTETLRSTPGVEAAAAVSHMPFRNFGGNVGAWAEDKPPEDPADARLAYRRVVLPGYFDTMGIPLRDGRDVDAADTDERDPVMLINRTMADALFPDRNPVGRAVVVDLGKPVRIMVIGVVGNVRLNGLDSQPDMAMYFPHGQQAAPQMRLALRVHGDPLLLSKSLTQAVRDLDPDIPVARLASLDAIIFESVSTQRVITVSLTLFAAFALLQAAVGLYGVLSHYVSQRRHDMGIRMALGAGRRQILNLILSRGALLVGIGLVVGLASAAGANRLIQNLLFGVAPTDPLTFVAVSLLFGAVALAACLIPALRATRADPASSLRAE